MTKPTLPTAESTTTNNQVQTPASRAACLPAPPKKTLKLSVGKLINFSCRSGDLQHAGPAGPSAQEGQAAHKKLQSPKRTNCKAEVSLKTELYSNGYQVVLSGRIDLLDDATAPATISEIKSCYAPPEKIPPSTIALHRAQLKVYGFCFLQHKNNTPDRADNLDDHSAETIQLQLVWYNLKTNQTTNDVSLHNFNDLQTFVTQAVDRYTRWQHSVDSSRSRSRETAKLLKFPHGQFRAGQREMAALIYRSARDRSRVLLEAPTGIGKTISALFAGSKALGEQVIDRLVYMTAKNSGRQAAGLALQQLHTAGMHISAITITAKKTTCHCTNGSCERDADGRCPRTIGFFDRLPAAREKLLSVGLISTDDIDAAATEYNLCPFELTQQMLPWVQVIVCDYNYVFDPLVRLSYFQDSNERHLLLIDEAHNLIDRARSMYSAEINRAQLRQTIADARSSSPLLCKALQSLNRAISRWANTQDGIETDTDSPPKALTKPLSRCADGLAEVFENASPISETLADTARELYRYAVIAELFTDQHRSITIKRQRHNAPHSSGAAKLDNVHVQLRCLDASAPLQKSMQAFHAVATFSATLRPQAFYLSGLGLTQNCTAHSLASPFDAQQQGTYLCKYIDTRYQARAASINPIVTVLHAAYTAKRGKYLAFFPSYAYMQQVFDHYTRCYPNTPTILQQRDATEQAREAFVQRFITSEQLLGFAIMGGVFGEGVDFTGEQLIGALVIGTGLPSISLEQKLIQQTYQQQSLDGYDYAARYPGFTRVLQTAGRVIRSEQDRGIVVLIDSRFGQNFYRNLYPPHWTVQDCSDHAQFTAALESFWETATTACIALDRSSHQPS